MPAVRPELLAPAGNWECVRAAAANGADAVYFGLGQFNARMRADNFTADDLPGLVAYCHERGMRALCAFNVLVFTDELAQARDQLGVLASAGVDAVIVQDTGLAWLARELAPGLAVHASTQMTLTSPEGVAWAQRRLGIRRAVLARELSLRELKKFALPGEDSGAVPLEVFVHGALCVAYSGQCLTSEALGQRSANRGECAQACRMPYQLVVDGVLRDMGDKRYLLSPQDLAAVHEIPELMRLGVASFKIEGRLKSPEYVAAVTQVYRRAIDAALADPELAAWKPDRRDEYQLEMAFSRGLFSGWMHGVNHQELVHARFGKKRGAFVGFVARAGRDHVEVAAEDPLGREARGRLHAAARLGEVAPGDGVVFDTGGDTNHEQGGRVFMVRDGKLYFGKGRLDARRLRRGDRIWKTDDPHLRRTLRASYAKDAPPVAKALDFEAEGKAGEPLRVTVRCGGDEVALRSDALLQPAVNRPLGPQVLRAHWGRLGGTGFALGEVRFNVESRLMLPVSELNRLRREAVHRLGRRPTAEAAARGSQAGNPRALEDALAALAAARRESPDRPVLLAALCRSDDQIEAALEAGVGEIFVDFEDIRRYRDAVNRVRGSGNAAVWLATPRIQKAGEQGFFQVIARAEPDGVLVRNLGALEWFAAAGLRRVGDFSLNVANPLAASLLRREGLERLTVSYDLNARQVVALLEAAPPDWFEITVHQHIPMFHMEHCVFAAFLSSGTDHTNCGRPCDSHRVELRDRVGQMHPLKADVGCRNTLYHGKAQSGAAYIEAFRQAGARTFRVEFLLESRDEAARTLRSYQRLLRGEMTPDDLVRDIQAVSQLGVTDGPLRPGMG